MVWAYAFVAYCIHALRSWYLTRNACIDVAKIGIQHYYLVNIDRFRSLVQEFNESVCLLVQRKQNIVMQSEHSV